jgi:hypothetical protein
MIIDGEKVVSGLVIGSGNVFTFVGPVEASAVDFNVGSAEVSDLISFNVVGDAGGDTALADGLAEAEAEGSNVIGLADRVAEREGLGAFICLLVADVCAG